MQIWEINSIYSNQSTFIAEVLTRIQRHLEALQSEATLGF